MDDRDEDSSPRPNAFLRGPSRGRVWLNTGQFGDRDMEKDAYDGPHDTHTIKYDYRMRLRVKGEIIGYIMHHGPFRVDLRDLGAPYHRKDADDVSLTDNVPQKRRPASAAVSANTAENDEAPEESPKPRRKRGKRGGRRGKRAGR